MNNLSNKIISRINGKVMSVYFIFLAYKLGLLCHRYRDCFFENYDLYNGKSLIYIVLVIFVLVTITVEKCRLLLFF